MGSLVNKVKLKCSPGFPVAECGGWATIQRWEKKTLKSRPCVPGAESRELAGNSAKTYLQLKTAAVTAMAEGQEPLPQYSGQRLVGSVSPFLCVRASLSSAFFFALG